MSDIAIDAAAEAVERDPRTAPFGLYSGGSFVLDSVRVFQWFESLEALADHLVEGQAAIYEFEQQDVDVYRNAVSPIAERLKATGFNDEILKELNAAVRSTYVVEWWGRFDELLAGKTEFSRGILNGYLDSSESQSVPEDEMDDFVEYLKTCGV